MLQVFPKVCGKKNLKNKWESPPQEEEEVSEKKQVINSRKEILKIKKVKQETAVKLLLVKEQKLPRIMERKILRLSKISRNSKKNHELSFLKTQNF